jgi:hypothetical protein
LSWEAAVFEVEGLSGSGKPLLIITPEYGAPNDRQDNLAESQIIYGLDCSSSQGQLFRALLLGSQAALGGQGGEHGGQLRHGGRGLHRVLGFEAQVL